MLDVNNVLPTLYKDRKMKKFTSIEIFSQLRTQSKRTEEGKKVKTFSKQMLVPKTKREKRGRYRSGVSPTFPQLAASLCLQAGPAAFFHGVLQTIGKTPLTT
jgi:hypothetical protein